MRNFNQLLVASLLVASQVTNSLPHPVVTAQSASIEAPAGNDNIKIAWTTTATTPVQVVITSPDIESEMLIPIRAAQAEVAKKAAEAAAAAKKAKKKTITKVVTLSANVPHVLSTAAITFLGTCESGMTWNRNSGNGFYGAFQFTIGTWNAMGTGYARADLAPLDVQINAVQALVARSNIYGQFPTCSRKMQALGLI